MNQRYCPESYQTRIQVRPSTEKLSPPQREMLIRRRSNTELPPTIAGVERVATMKILGVTIREDLGTSTHIDGILGVCSRSLYALRVLRSHGLPTTALHDVARATTVSRLLYAAPAWWGFTKAEDRNRLDRFLQRSRRSP